MVPRHKKSGKDGRSAVWLSRELLIKLKGKKQMHREAGTGAADTPEGWDAIHRDLYSLEKWDDKNLIRFNKAKCKVLHMGQDNPDMSIDWKKTEEKDLRVLMNEKLDMSHSVHLQP